MNVCKNKWLFLCLTTTASIASMNGQVNPVDNHYQHLEAPEATTAEFELGPIIHLPEYFLTKNATQKESINPKPQQNINATRLAEALRIACQKQPSYLSEVRRYIQLGANVNASDAKGNTALNIASGEGKALIVRYLLQNRANANIRDKKGRAALHLAVNQTQASVVEILVDYGACLNIQDNDGNTPLHAAIIANNISAAQTLLKNGAPVNAQNFYGNTPLHIAANIERFSNAHTMSILLLDFGADPTISNGRELPALSYSRIMRNQNLLQSFTKNTVQPQPKPKWPFFMQQRLSTPLHEAVWTDRYTEIMRLTARTEAIESTNSFGETPLHLAAIIGNEKTINHLIKKHANCSAKDNAGNTPLHSAAKRGHASTVAFLLAHNAPINTPNQAQESPLGIALRNNDRKTVNVLLAHGAPIMPQFAQLTIEAPIAQTVGQCALLDTMANAHQIDDCFSLDQLKIKFEKQNAFITESNLFVGIFRLLTTFPKKFIDLMDDKTINAHVNKYMTNAGLKEKIKALMEQIHKK